MAADLFRQITTQKQGLLHQGRRMQVASNNLAHLGDPNYTRQITESQPGDVARKAGSLTHSLGNLSVQQALDCALEDKVWAQEAAVASARTELCAMERLTYTLAESVSGSEGLVDPQGVIAENARLYGLSGAMNQFFHSANQFAAQPSGGVARQNFFNKAQALTEAFHTVNRQIGDQAASVQAGAADAVASSNSLLEAIAQVNQKISKSENPFQPGEAFELRDQRAGLLRQLQAQVGMEVVFNQGPMGPISLQLRTANGQAVPILEGPKRLETLVWDADTQQLQTSGNPPAALTPQGGALQGYQQWLAQGYLTAQNGLNDLAHQWVVAANTAYGQWTNPQGQTGNFFNPAGQTAATIALDGGLSANFFPATDGTLSGGNEKIKALCQLSGRTFSRANGDWIDTTLVNAQVSLAKDAALRTQVVENTFQVQQKALSHAQSQREALSGVNLEESMVEMMAILKEYQASLRTLSQCDALLEDFFQLVGNRLV